MGQVRRLLELDPLHFRELVEEGLNAIVVNFVVSSVGQQRPVGNFRYAFDDRPGLERSDDVELRWAVPFEVGVSEGSLRPGKETHMV